MTTEFTEQYPSIDLNGKSILITGGTGSFGKRFIKTILARFNLKRVIVFSRDELKQFEMALEPDFKDQEVLRYFIGDIRDRDRLMMAMRNVDYVVHAAALKQVMAAEYNPFECIKTNVIGAQNVVEAALHNGVKKVLALSTDKAASPVNLYGATKLASDKIFVAANNLRGHSDISFAVVRYGNVVGSRGSIVPYFQQLVREGAESLPITDDRMTRFWITLDQGVDFVLSSLQLMEGGEVFIPKIPSMKVTDLAKVIAPDLPYHITGIRPGEKLHEMMITRDDSRTTIDVGDRYIIEPSMMMWDQTGATAEAKKAKLQQEAAVEEGFEYSSDTNDEWLSLDGIRAMIESTKEESSKAA